MNSKTFGKEREYKQESNKKQTLNGDKTHTWRAIQASCGVRINYDKVIKEAFDSFVTAKTGWLIESQVNFVVIVAPCDHTLMVVY